MSAEDIPVDGRERGGAKGEVKRFIKLIEKKEPQTF